MPEPISHRADLGHAVSGYGPSWRQQLCEPLENLRQFGHRAVLSLLGVAVGCMAVVALLNIGYNAEREAMRVFQGMGSDLLVASVQRPETGRSLTSPYITTLDTEALRQALPGITAAAPLIPSNMEVHIRGRAMGISVIGSGAQLSDVLNLRLAQGRFLSPFDQQSTHVVLGGSLVAQWASTGVRVTLGEHVQIGSYLFQVIGILQPHGVNPLLPVDPDNSMVMTLDSMRRITPTPQITSVLARHPHSATLVQSAALWKDWLQDRMPGWEVKVQIPSHLISGMARQSRLFSWLLAGLGGIALLVGGIGVMNVMLMNVAERRREIGVRMALGARPRDIACLFLLEAVMLVVLGALAGVTVGLVMAWAFVHYSGWSPFTLSASSLPLGIGSAIVTGLFFGLSPAMAAARLTPVQALRDV